MKECLRKLLRRYEYVRMSDKEKAEQRKSFAYGNVKIDNDAVTREMVNKAAAAMEKEVTHKNTTSESKKSGKAEEKKNKVWTCCECDKEMPSQTVDVQFPSTCYDCTHRHRVEGRIQDMFARWRAERKGNHE